MLKLDFFFVLAVEIIQVLDSIAWVRCASGNVLGTWHILFGIKYFLGTMYACVGWTGDLGDGLAFLICGGLAEGGRVDPLTYTTQGTMPKRYRGFLN